MFCPHILVNCYYLKPEDTGPPTPQNTSMLQHQTMQIFFFFFCLGQCLIAIVHLSFYYRSWQHYEDRKKETCAIISYRIMYLKLDRRYFRPGYTWTVEV